ncbi:MAG: hypothetical protein Salg2KO_22650 [Salibacteraceae bacterium]
MILGCLEDTIGEIKEALAKCKDMGALGPDLILYLVFKKAFPVVDI